jgi:glycosyltransferase involved in cell wall biosynthesis
MTLLSVCIPTKDRINHLRNLLARLLEALPSCPFCIELLVLDNASIRKLDPSEVRSISTHVPIRVISQSTDIGFAENYLQALREAKGKWCWILGDDDIYDFKSIFEAIHKTEDLSKCFYDSSTISLIHVNQSQFEDFEGVSDCIKERVHKSTYCGIVKEDEFLKIVSKSAGGLLFVGSNIFRMNVLMQALDTHWLRSNPALCICTPLLAIRRRYIYFIGTPLIQNRLNAPWSGWLQQSEFIFRVDVPSAILASRNPAAIYELLLTKTSPRTFIKAVLVGMQNGNPIKVWYFISRYLHASIMCLGWRINGELKG